MIMATDSFSREHALFTSHRPRVAVVIVNYRTPDQTIACVKSLFGVNYPLLRIIVVDNDSRDGSTEKIRAAVPRVEVISSSVNGGYTDGNNLGIEHALSEGADFVLILNPDTVCINRDFIFDLVEFAECQPRVGAVGPRVFLRSKDRVQNTVLTFPWLWRRAWGMIRSRLMGNPLRSGEKAIKAEVLNGVCVLFRAEALFEVGLFDAETFAYIEDVDWAYRAEKLGWQRWYIPVDSIIHEQKEAGYHRGSNVDFLLKRNTLYFLLKTGHRNQAFLYTLATLSMSKLLEWRGKVKPADWSKRLFQSYEGLWRGRWHAVMGKPSV